MLSLPLFPQLRTVEEVAASRGRVVTTSYVFISDEGPLAASAAPSRSSAAPAEGSPSPFNAAASATATTAAAATAAGMIKKRPRGSKPRELWLALSQLEGSSGYLNAASVTLGGRGPIDLRRCAAVPMRARDRGPLSPPRTLKEEILLAITEGVTHDLLRPARIERKDHHIRGLPSLRKRDNLDIVGCIWTGAIYCCCRCCCCCCCCCALCGSRGLAAAGLLQGLAIMLWKGACYLG